MTLSVMITTRNRLVELRRTYHALQQLDPPPLEVLIAMDGCTDEIVDLIKAELSQARLFVNRTGVGSVVSRDRMIREARGDLVLALDDDSYPEQLDCISRFTTFFEERPRLAVLHFPQRTDEYRETLTQTKFGSEHLTRSFANSGAVLRRATYLQLPGFEPRFYHMYEEPDYALQCVAAGYDVCFSPVVTIRHHYSKHARDEIRIHQRHSRNELWSTLMRCPFPFTLGLLVWRVISQFRYACKRGWSWVVREPVWWWQALVGVPHCLRNRRPVPWSGYKRWLRLP
ncbi:MAG TPA: glycosyltransferase family A protein [Candidatus Udaeobacter sp.]|nr:glycosyltransferase family A protein [Candidatus Udaeobacter sp.]